MALAIDIFGYQYDAADAPAFIDAGDFWWHRPTERLLTKASVTAYLNSFTPHKTMGANESGSAPAAFLKEHLGMPVAAAAPVQPPAGVQPGGIGITQPTGLPITGDAAGTRKVTLDMDFHGQTLATAAVAAVAYNIGATDKTVTANLTQGMTGHQAAVAIAAAINAVAGLGAAATGTTITVTPTDTTALSKLTLAIA